MSAPIAIPVTERHGSWFNQALANRVRTAVLRFLTAWPSALAVLGIFVCTWVFFGLGQSLGSVGFLYLVFVVLAALYGGFWQATLVSVIAVGCLDFFFDEPVFSFTVARVSNWVELGVFEFTALIISQLSNRAHLRELEAISERRETARLYQTAQRLLLFENPQDPGERVTSLIQEVFELSRVALFDGVSKSIFVSGDPLSDHDREKILARCSETYSTDSDGLQSGEKQWFCTVRFGDRPIGALALFGKQMSPLIISGIASLVAIALERARTLQVQCQSEAARQAEQLRTAVLDALAHKFKTPLTVIRTANSGLPAVGSLSETQRELVRVVDQEVRMLNDLASRLLGAPQLDVKEFQPQPEPLLLSRLVKAAVQEREMQADRDRFQISVAPSEPAVFADRELILTALAQLVDNGLKYSVAGSPIETKISVEESVVTLRMSSKGLVVADEDRERIFERFYRAPGAQDFSGGTGLGLSIVKTIAADHRGAVRAEGQPGFGTVFTFELPAMQGVACEQ